MVVEQGSLMGHTTAYQYFVRHLTRYNRWVREQDEAAAAQGLEELPVIEGTAQSILLLLNDLGDVPSELSKKIVSEKNPDILNQWLKAAAKAESIEQFIQSSSIRL